MIHAPEPLRIAVLGDFDGPHTRRWLSFFVQRGHDVHAVSYYPPREPLAGVKLHVLDQRSPVAFTMPIRASRGLYSRLPRSLTRLLQAVRYQRAGLAKCLDEVNPDVFHAHYVVEHGFYGALSHRRPYVVSAWGSDLYVESHKPAGHLIARYVLRKADMVTANDPAMAHRARQLGLKPQRLAVVRLGLEQSFLAEADDSVNYQPGSLVTPTVFSDRALEPLYNIDRIIRAIAIVRKRLPEVRLFIANDGSQRPDLERLTTELGLRDSVHFLGRLSQDQIREQLLSSHVYVSVPRSDSFSLSNLEAMATGAFPVLSDLPSTEGWIEHGSNGLLSIDATADSLAGQIYEALTRHELRRQAIEVNRARVERDGMLEKNMQTMEDLYYQLARGGGSRS